LAARLGIEPRTTRLTAGRTTAVLSRKIVLVQPQGLEPRNVRLKAGCLDRFGLGCMELVPPDGIEPPTRCL
jgi:hypothetical protein